MTSKMQQQPNNNNQTGLDIIMSLDPPVRDKVIQSTSRMSGQDRMLVLQWIINGRQSSVRHTLRLWNEKNWGSAELTTLAWTHKYGIKKEDDDW